MDLIDDSHNGVVEIDDVDPVLFETAIVHLYLGEIPEIFKKETTKAVALLGFANKFGFKSLKLKLDFELATPANAAEMFVLAVSHSCALLKEKATKQLSSTPGECRRSKGWSLVQESPQLLEELLNMALCWNNEEMRKEMYPHATVIDRMHVSSLLHCLKEVGLDLDGDRDFHVMRLKNRLEPLAQLTTMKE